MPNWCLNRVAVSNADPRMVKRIIRTWYGGGDLLDEFLPRDDDLEDDWEPTASAKSSDRKATLPLVRKVVKYAAEDWVRWGIKHWGNRWYVFGEADRLDLVSPTKIKLTLETRWGPPWDLFDCWADLGSDVRAWFYVCETDLTGTYANKTVAPLPNVRELKLPPKLANRG
jgi:hypothetical protein